MRASVAIPVVLAALGAAAFAATALSAWLAVRHGGNLGAYLSIAFVLVAMFVGVVWSFLSRKLIEPIAALTRELVIHTQTSLSRPIALREGHLLDQLPRAVKRSLDELRGARGETQDVVDAATKRADEQKNRLEAILLDLSEGVMVCNLEHNIILYNHAAARILNVDHALGLDRSVFGVLTREPVLNALELLHAANVRGSRADIEKDATRRFVATTIDLGTLLEARLSLVRDGSGQATGYVLTFADASAEFENLALRDSLLREVAVQWRQPLASLRAAAEMLDANPGLEAGERRIFEEIIAKEVETLNQCYGGFARRHAKLATGPWPLFDMHSLDLFRMARKHLAEAEGIQATPIGIPTWIRADGHSLLLALEYLVRAVARKNGISAFDLEAVTRDRYAYLTISWYGEPIASATIESWLDEPLEGTVANRTLRQIVELHGSELWSEKLAGDQACLRFPLRAADRPRVPASLDEARPRPELYDLDLLRTPSPTLGDTLLRKLSFVVFDTETTGVRPEEGDELLSIGAIRIVNGRILTGETFERLINPGRAIPAGTTRVHGITSDMVRDKPPAQVVLPQFKAFVGDCVLVAYNAAFDLTFLRNKEKESGVHFDNPVLDALMLGLYLHPDVADHSLSASAQRLDVEVIARHTALGDAMTTAAIFLRQLDLLEARGVETFGQAARISSRAMEHRRQAPV